MYFHSQEVKDKVESIVRIGAAQGQSEGIISKWFQHLPETEQKELAASIRNSSHVMNALKGILVREYDELLKERPDEYSRGDWALRQADKAGYKRAIQNFITLLTITK